MTRLPEDINPKKCLRCTHFNGHFCTLQDLDPCRYQPTPDAETEKAKNRVLAFVVAFAAAVILLILTLC